jgi:hypothetical protein
MSLPVLRGSSAAINWTRKLQARGQAAALAGGTGNVRLVIVSKRRPAGFPMRDLGGPAVQRFAKERCREPAAIDALVATVMRRSPRACQN